MPPSFVVVNCKRFFVFFSREANVSRETMNVSDTKTYQDLGASLDGIISKYRRCNQNREHEKFSISQLINCCLKDINQLLILNHLAKTYACHLATKLRTVSFCNSCLMNSINFRAIIFSQTFLHCKYPQSM